MVNSLTREAGVKFGPLILETLIKHYFDRLVKDNVSQGRVLTKLRKDELLYDEAFIIVKVRREFCRMNVEIFNRVSLSDVSGGCIKVSVSLHSRPSRT